MWFRVSPFIVWRAIIDSKDNYQIEVTAKTKHLDETIWLLPQKTHTLIIQHSRDFIEERRLFFSDEEYGWDKGKIAEYIAHLMKREDETIKFIAIWDESWITTRKQFFKDIHKNKFLKVSPHTIIRKCRLYEQLS